LRIFIIYRLIYFIFKQEIMKFAKSRKFLLVSSVLVLLTLTLTGCTKVSLTGTTNVPGAGGPNGAPVDGGTPPDGDMPPSDGGTPPAGEMPAN
jgi:hypothetical protein